MPETATLFDNVAARYDLLNRILSVGLDRGWRRALVRSLGPAPSRVLDVATGTGDVAVEVARIHPDAEVVGIDPSRAMLEAAARKVRRLGLGGRVRLIEGVAERLPFGEGEFDAVTIAFGIRNTCDPRRSLDEMYRVCRPGGRIGVLEFTMPTNRLFAPIYSLYLGRLIPFVGSLLGMRREYEWLAASIPAFAQREGFEHLLAESGFEPLQRREFALGTVALYVAEASG